MINNIRVLKFILKHIKPYRWYIRGMFLAVCLVTLDNTLKPYIVKNLIDTISGNADNNLWKLCGLYGLLTLILVGAWSFNDFCMVRYTAKMRTDITNHFIEKMYSYPYTFFQNQMSGNLTTKVNDVFNNVPSIIFTTIHDFGYFILLVIISLTLLTTIHPIFAIILIGWIILFTTITYLSMKKAIVYTKEYAEKKSKLFGVVADYLSNMLNVKTFTAKSFELTRFNKPKRSFLKIAQKQGFYFVKFYIVQGALTATYSTSFIASLIYCHNNGWITPGDFAFVVMINFSIISNLFQLSHLSREFVINWGTVDQALLVLDETLAIHDMDSAKNLSVAKGKIVFDKVQFHYKESEAIFKKKSITIEAGQKVGLVGYSGGGKSTFVNLILRLYEITEGRILIDDQNISEVTQDSLRKSISMIPQDPSLFHRSLRENIRYGRIDATDNEVIEAAKKAHAHEFIISLPNKYESLVGERGIKLSGGQRQRIAIARAILKNAPILILDEATSQLDSVTENYIQESLWLLMQGKTTLVVAHRLSTLLHMDRILVFDKGKIIEDGTHIELLAKGGLYKTLWDAQVGGFLPDEKL